jgi:hypothetical protein
VTILDFQIDEPTTIHEALIDSKGENWNETLEVEYYVLLLKNQTWRLETLPCPS